MTITLDISPETQAELARQAAERGIEVDAYAASLLEKAAHVPEVKQEGLTPPPQEVLDAIDRLTTFGKRHGLSLGDMTIQQLREEARP